MKSTLPAWAVDSQGNVAPSVTLDEVLSNDALFDFATDKNGCRFLQEEYPVFPDDVTHNDLFCKMVQSREGFLVIDCFGCTVFFFQNSVCSRCVVICSETSSFNASSNAHKDRSKKL